jgi:hypothetical protein
MFAAYNKGKHGTLKCAKIADTYCLSMVQLLNICSNTVSYSGRSPTNFFYASQRVVDQTPAKLKTAQPNPFISRAYFICFGTNRRAKATPILYST